MPPNIVTNEREGERPLEERKPITARKREKAIGESPVSSRDEGRGRSTAEDDDDDDDNGAPGDSPRKLVWSSILAVGFLHAGCLLSFPTVFCYAKILTLLWCVLVGIVAGFGVTGGVHRLWTHRSYKAKWPLRLFLMLSYSAAGHNKIFDWVRDHRVHHKFSETHADPHNSSRGFFFAHVGWLMMRKHPEVIEKGRQVDMSDILADPIVRFADRFYWPLKLLFCFYLPTIMPVYCWGESWYNAIMAQVFFRYTFTLNFTWSVNSFAHLWGTRPYDKSISPVENKMVALAALGEGWHNYHHVFPWDYKAAELGNYSLNFTTMMIDAFAKIGWAYDLKQPNRELVRNIVANRGDGSHPLHGLAEVPPPQ